MNLFCTKEVGPILSCWFSCLQAKFLSAAFKWAVLAGQQFIIIPFNASDEKKLQRIKIERFRSISLDSAAHVPFNDEQISKRTAKITISFTNPPAHETQKSTSSSPTRRGFFQSMAGSLSLPSSPLRRSKGFFIIDQESNLYLKPRLTGMGSGSGGDFFGDEDVKQESFFVHEEGSKVP